MTPAIAATLAAGAALLLAGVALKRADDAHADFVDQSHLPLHQEDR
jgi:hypothetical protein